MNWDEGYFWFCDKMSPPKQYRKNIRGKNACKNIAKAKISPCHNLHGHLCQQNTHDIQVKWHPLIKTKLILKKEFLLPMFLKTIFQPRRFRSYILSGHRIFLPTCSFFVFDTSPISISCVLERKNSCNFKCQQTVAASDFK